ncbi:response regulator [Thioalkalivibrio sp.]|uniref:response regulator n=1 Tax=Thioalkalivibrio sp. TaxID=2093813 RepID=UPI00356ACDDF
MESAGDLQRARAAFAASPWDLVITDLRLPDGSGLDVLRLFDGLADPPACLMITAFGSVRDAVAALSEGACCGSSLGPPMLHAA